MPGGLDPVGPLESQGGTSFFRGCEPLFCTRRPPCVQCFCVRKQLGEMPTLFAQAGPYGVGLCSIWTGREFLNGRSGRHVCGRCPDPRSSACPPAGCKPRPRKRSLTICRSFSSASLRGLGSIVIWAPVRAAINRARSRTRWFSVIWFRIFTLLPRCGGFCSARSTQRQVSCDVDEGAGLAFGAMQGQRIADRGLHQEPVQRRAVIPVLVETVYQPVIPAGFLGLRA